MSVCMRLRVECSCYWAAINCWTCVDKHNQSNRVHVVLGRRVYSPQLPPSSQCNHNWMHDERLARSQLLAMETRRTNFSHLINFHRWIDCIELVGGGDVPTPTLFKPQIGNIVSTVSIKLNLSSFACRVLSESTLIQFSQIGHRHTQLNGPAEKNAILIRFCVFCWKADLKRENSIRTNCNCTSAEVWNCMASWLLHWNDECTYATYHGRFRVCEIRFNETEKMFSHFCCRNRKYNGSRRWTKEVRWRMKIRSFCSRLIRCRYVPECPLMTYNLCN